MTDLEKLELAREILRQDSSIALTNQIIEKRLNELIDDPDSLIKEMINTIIMKQVIEMESYFERKYEKERSELLAQIDDLKYRVCCLEDQVGL